MADDEKLSGKVGLDTTDFKTGLAGMNRELRVIESGFRASAAGLGDWAQNASGLEMRIGSLTKSIEVQQQKIAAVRGEYERVKAEKGETSRAAQDLEIKLNKETETLGKMESELRNTESSLAEMQDRSDQAEQSVDDLGETSEETGGKLEGFKTVLHGVGAVAKATVGILLGLVAGVAAVAATVSGLVFSSASASAELVDMSAKTGISTERLQELNYIGEQVGTSLDTIATSQARLTRTMAAAQSGSKDAADAFKTLGVDVENTDGTLRSQQEVFEETLDALGQIENAAERDALAMQIFGRGAMELNPLIKTGSDEMGRLADEAHRVGAVMSEEDVAGLEAFDDTLASLKLGLQGTLGTLSTAFLPGFQAVFGQLGGYLQTFAGIVNTSVGDTDQVINGLTGLFTRIVGDIATQAPQLLQAGLGIVQAILSAIVKALPQLLSAGISILNTLVNFIVQNLPMLIDAGVQILLTLVNAILPQLPLLVEAGIQAITMLMNGLASAAPELVPVIVLAIGQILQVIMDNLPAFLDAGARLLISISQGLVNAVPQSAKESIERFLTELTWNIVSGAIRLAESGKELLQNLKDGLINGLPSLGEIGAKIGETLKKAVVGITFVLLGVGKDIVNGIWRGIEALRDWFYQKVFDYFEGIVEAVQSALGIQSPSKVMYAQGVQVVRGFALGIGSEMGKLEQQMAAAFGGLAVNPAFSVTPTGGFGSGAGGAGGNVTNVYLYGVQVGSGVGRDVTLGQLLEKLNQ